MASSIWASLGAWITSVIQRWDDIHGLSDKLSDEVGFCEACIHGKHKRASFNKSSSKSTQPLELVHSDVCGKMSSSSLGGAEYFLIFINDYTHYTWVIPLKRKSDKFVKWKALVENESEKCYTQMVEQSLHPHP